jgi:hypothetical protein
MTARRQSPEHRLRRLLASQCPVHGAPMGQTGLLPGRVTFIAGCTRKDCNIEGVTDEPGGAVELLPQWRYLIDDPDRAVDCKAPRDASLRVVSP